MTPNTIVASTPLAGAVTSTQRAPASRCAFASDALVKRPVPSNTRSTPSSFHGSLVGSGIAVTLTFLPLTTKPSASAVTVAAKRPCTESYLSRCASVGASVMSLTATNSKSGSANACR